jgi:hypothetical protein
MIVRYNFNGEVVERGPMVVFISDGCVKPMRVTFDVHLNAYVECGNGVFNAVRYDVYHFDGIKKYHVSCGGEYLVYIGNTGTWGWLPSVYDSYRPLVFVKISKSKTHMDFVKLCGSVSNKIYEKSKKVYKRAYGVGFGYEAEGELLNVVDELMKREDLFIVV